MTNYHSGIAEGKVDRKKEFLNNHGGWKSVKSKIDSWTPEDYILSKRTTRQGIDQAKKNFKTYLKPKPIGIENLFN